MDDCFVYFCCCCECCLFERKNQRRLREQAHTTSSNEIYNRQNGAGNPQITSFAFWGFCPFFPGASVGIGFPKSSAPARRQRWQILILASPLRLASCFPAQAAAPALGLSAVAGLIPPVMRFAAAGRPRASICSGARRDAKRRAARWRTIISVLCRALSPTLGRIIFYFKL